jgi:hypothetical protein
MTKARDLANASTALSAVSATELAFLDGVTSAVQTQVDAKIAKTLTTTTGDIIYASGANTPARLGIGSSAQVLTVSGGVPAWATPASGLTYVGAQVTNTSSQSIPNGTYTTLNFQSENFDTDGFHDNSTNNSRLTIPAGKGGKYLITTQINFANNSTGLRIIEITKNGGATLAQSMFSPISGSTSTFAFSCVVSAVATDYFTMQAYQSSGGSLNVNSGSDSTRFDISYLGA